MCKKYVAVTIYRCGNRVTSDFKFDTCWSMAAPDHILRVGELGSKRARAVCGLYTCEVCPQNCVWGGKDTPDGPGLGRGYFLWRWGFAVVTCFLHLGARFPHGPELNARKQPKAKIDKPTSDKKEIWGQPGIEPGTTRIHGVCHEHRVSP
ncbi:hypothetical protein VUR80DRAFT_3671 [Thermomyces stellatus]